MQAHEQAQFLTAVGEYIRGQIDVATKPLLEKIKNLEDELRDIHTKPLVDEDDVSCMITAAIDSREALSFNHYCKIMDEVALGVVEQKLAVLPAPKDGKDVDMDIVKDVISHLVESRLEEEIKKFSVVDGEPGPAGPPGPPGKDGASIDMTVVVPMIDGMIKLSIEDFVARLPKPADGAPGKDVDWDAVKHEINCHFLVAEDKFKEFVASIPKPKDGEPGKDGLPGRDGADTTNMVINREGELVVTLSNGNMKTVGPVVGKDGAPGAPGAPGKDGRDGFGFDDLRLEYDGERTLQFVFTKGEAVHTDTIILSHPIYREIWKQGTYEKGDCVTLGGSLFIAQRQTDSKPETDDAWKLCVKHGREGKPGAKGEPGKDGKPGKDGRDLTQLGPDGSKWR